MDNKLLFHGVKLIGKDKYVIHSSQFKHISSNESNFVINTYNSFVKTNTKIDLCTFTNLCSTGSTSVNICNGQINFCLFRDINVRIYNPSFNTNYSQNFESQFCEFINLEYQLNCFRLNVSQFSDISNSNYSNLNCEGNALEHSWTTIKYTQKYFLANQITFLTGLFYCFQAQTYLAHFNVLNTSSQNYLFVCGWDIDLKVNDAFIYTNNISQILNIGFPEVGNNRITFYNTVIINNNELYFSNITTSNVELRKNLDPFETIDISLPSEIKLYKYECSVNSQRCINIPQHAFLVFILL